MSLCRGRVCEAKQPVVAKRHYFHLIQEKQIIHLLEADLEQDIEVQKDHTDFMLRGTEANALALATEM